MALFRLAQGEDRQWEPLDHAQWVDGGATCLVQSFSLFGIGHCLVQMMLEMNVIHKKTRTLECTCIIDESRQLGRVKGVTTRIFRSSRNYLIKFGSYARTDRRHGDWPYNGVEPRVCETDSFYWKCRQTQTVTPSVQLVNGEPGEDMDVGVFCQHEKKSFLGRSTGEYSEPQWLYSRSFDWKSIEEPSANEASSTSALKVSMSTRRGRRPVHRH